MKRAQPGAEEKSGMYDDSYTNEDDAYGEAEARRFTRENEDQVDVREAHKVEADECPF